MSAKEFIKFDSEGLSLEARLGLSGAVNCPAVVICHPHPQFGGSMNNNVVFALEQQFSERGFSTLSFNFRGVGNSEGEYSEMRGETEDVISALLYLSKKEEIDNKKICLAGYSFGGLMSLYAASKIISLSGLSESKEPAKDAPLPAALALVSPMDPGKGYQEEQWNKPLFTCPPSTFIATGTRDPFCPVKTAKELCVNIGPKAKLVIVEGADHFYGQMEYEAAVPAAEFAASIIGQ